MKHILVSLTAIAIIIMAASLGHAASLAEGTTLYATHCEECHNPLATSEKKGSTVTRIQTAITGNKGGMGYLSSLTADQVLSIAIALGGATAPPPTPTPTPSITLTSSVTGSTVNLSWTVANMTGVSSYSVLRNGVSVGTAMAMSYANTGVANGTYSYQVRALSSTSAVLATSNTVSATVNVAPAPVPSITLTSTVSGSTVNLSWTIANLTGASSYSILRNGVSVGTAAATALSYANTGLANGTYSYQVRALSSTSAVLATSNTVSATVNVAPAPAPSPIDGAALFNTKCAGCHTMTSLSGRTATQIQNAINANMGGMGSLSNLTSAEVAAIAAALSSTPTPTPTPSVTLTSSVSGSTVNLSWTIANLTGVSSYSILRNGAKVGTAAASARSYSNTGLANGTYSYEVDAVNSTGAVLAKSNVVSATVNVAPAPTPVADITLTSSVLGKKVTLNWTKAGLAGVARYKIMRNGVRIAATTSLSYTNYGLANGTYSYEVDAVNSTGAVLARSNVVSATINVIPAVTLTSSVSGNTVTLRWTKSYLTGVARYRIMRNGVRIGAATTMSYTNSGLANGTYSYEVDAMNMYGTVRARSNVVSVTVNVASAPAPAPAPTDGATLYGTKCSGCHGPLATSNVKGKSAQLIQNAVNNNLGGMGTLKTLTADQVSSIAGALAIAPAPAPAPQPVIDGAALYTAKCASCHEPLATSKMKGKTATQIQNAIDANKGGMGTLKSLTPEQVSAISKALAGGTTGSKFTDPDCAVCHYSDGKVRPGAGPMPGGDDD